MLRSLNKKIAARILFESNAKFELDFVLSMTHTLWGYVFVCFVKSALEMWKPSLV